METWLWKSVGIIIKITYYYENNCEFMNDCAIRLRFWIPSSLLLILTALFHRNCISFIIIGISIMSLWSEQILCKVQQTTMYLAIKSVLVIGKVSKIFLNRPFKRPNDLSISYVKMNVFCCILFQFPLNVHYLEKEPLYISLYLLINL